MDGTKAILHSLTKIIKQLVCICKHGFKKKRVYSHQSSKKRVSNSSLIFRVFLLILEEYLSSLHITFNDFRDFYLLFYSFRKSTVIYNYCYKHSE